MRVLVVDDEPTAQKVMQLFLTRSGYTPIIHSEGSKVLEVAQSDDPPPIIVLDWMMPGADGLSLCKDLRAAKLKSRPYIFMLSSKTSRDDVAVALDAGADDYVTKPFHINELQARLRVARRTVEYQRELQRHIEDNESLNQRNSLLGELISKQQPVPPAPPPPSVVPAPQPAGDTTVLPIAKTDVAFGTHEVRFLLSATLMELRLALERVTLRADVAEPRLANYGAWSALLVHSQSVWLDLVLLARGDAMGKLFAQSLGRLSASMSENEVFFAELARVVGLGFVRTLNARHASAVQPLLSRTLNFNGRSGLPALPLETKLYDLVIEGQEVQLLVMVSGGAYLQVPPSLLRESDILAEPYPPTSRTEVPIFKEGVAMTPRFIDKLVDQMEVEPPDWTLPIYRPSPLAKFFQRGVRTFNVLD